MEDIKGIKGITDIADIKIVHPRPSSIVASLYTLRDMKIDVAILHGPPGCSFKHARLLEEDGIHVLTSAMDENDFVFGGLDKLKFTIEKAIELFSPKSIAIVGTCTSMIIGEELSEAVSDYEDKASFICVEIHAGYANNTDGVIAVLEPAVKSGLLSEDEFSRQKEILQKATAVEIKAGAASQEYLAPSRGDIKYKVAERLIQLLRENKKGVLILNAKKETAYMFADEIVATYEIAKKLGVSENISVLSNTDVNLGLPRVREHAENIEKGYKEAGVVVDDIIGGLDEYGVTGKTVLNLMKTKYTDSDFVLIVGVPHAIPPEAFENMEIFSITNGPRQVLPLKEIGHDHVIVEIDLHPKTLGVDKIIPSEFGDNLRSVFSDSL